MEPAELGLPFKRYGYGALVAWLDSNYPAAEDAPVGEQTR
jgi:hypothetical protein